jgi:hypothetical protein
MVPGWRSSFREIVRQQWNFSPPNTTREHEKYHVELSDVAVLELVIVPDISRGTACASLKSLDEGWLDLDSAATVEVTSEAKEYPVEFALVSGEMRGWRAADSGTQTIWDVQREAAPSLRFGLDVLPFRPQPVGSCNTGGKAAGKGAPRYKKSHFTKSCHSDAERSGGKENLLSSKLSARRGHVIQWCPPP